MTGDETRTGLSRRSFLKKGATGRRMIASGAPGHGEAVVTVRSSFLSGGALPRPHQGGMLAPPRPSQVIVSLDVMTSARWSSLITSRS